MFGAAKYKLVAGVTAAALVFAQAVYAAEACVHAQASAAKAVAMSAMSDCEQQVKSPASCVAQCSADSQNSASPVVAIPAPPSVAVLTLPVLQSVAIAGPVRSAPLPASGPAPPIRFCTFLL